jgi:uncharacterized protein YdeI (YjbR/CyaY-like superfamily)
MAKNDPRIDAYIAQASPFARPILKHLRKLIHQGCPDAEETIKWGSPHFNSAGDPLAGMAAFKAHCAFGFWKSSLLPGVKADRTPEAMGQFGRIASLEDLPSDARLLKLVRAAAKLNADGVKVKKPKAAPKPALPVPADLAKALAKNKKAKATFDAFPPGAKREYVTWLLEAKRAETRAARLAKAIAAMAEGKSRYWQYKENC